MQWPLPLNVVSSMSRLAYTSLRIGGSTAWSLIFVLVAFAAIGDLLTGKDIWFGPIYLFILCMATWLLGWVIGHGIGIFCMLLSFVINGAVLYPYATSVFSLDLMLRFIAMSIVLSAIAAVRGAYMREWWLARIEPMTGTLNRQAFFEFADINFSSHDWRVLMYADLDCFKSINDCHGHAAGDECLRDFARAVRSSVGKESIFARMGGDEFIVLMAVEDEAAFLRVAARLHSVMNKIPTRFEGDLRCSVGALLVPPGEALLDDLVRQADALMYKAKSKGAALHTGQAILQARPATCGRPGAPNGLFPASTHGTDLR